MPREAALASPAGMTVRRAAAGMNFTPIRSLR